MVNAIDFMKKILFLLTVVFFFVVICNIAPVRWIFRANDCEFGNNDGSFTYSEMTFKERGFKKCYRNFLEFKKRKLGDTTLYRLCPKNIFHFWDYGQYLFSEKYRIPYKPWAEIEARRGPITNKSGFQDF